MLNQSSNLQKNLNRNNMKGDANNKLMSFNDGIERSYEWVNQYSPSLAALLMKLYKASMKPFVAIKAYSYKMTGGLIRYIPVRKTVALCFCGFVAWSLASNVLKTYGGLDVFASISEENVGTEYLKNDNNTVTSDYAPVSAKKLKEKDPKEYIKRFKNVAIAEMERYGIPASIKMGQALIESRAGTSRLATNNNNHFGVKCFSRNCRRGHCTNHTDDSHKDFFRKYKTAWESWRAHSQFISTKKRYAGLFNEGLDYKAWAKGLKEAGYATDKNYDKKLINVIEQYNLQELDKSKDMAVVGIF